MRFWLRFGPEWHLTWRSESYYAENGRRTSRIINIPHTTTRVEVSETTYREWHARCFGTPAPDITEPLDTNWWTSNCHGTPLAIAGWYDSDAEIEALL